MNRMKRIQKGFTLIELMIVVAIIGILAAVAIPSYQDYVVKAKLSKVSSTVDPIKTAIAAYVQENGSYMNATGVAGDGGSAGEAWTSLGLSGQPDVPKEVKTMTVTASAGNPGNTITLLLQNIKSGIDGMTITMTPPDADAITSAIRWVNTCSISEPITKKYFDCTTS